MTLRTPGGWLRASVPILFLVAGLAPSRAGAASEWSAVAEALGREGGLSGGVYKVSFPRTDLRVAVDGTPIRTGLALGGWAAFARETDTTVVDGDLVLLPEEVNPVVSTLLANGLEVTALHNHLILETPRVMYLHFFGTGDAAVLARGLRAALAGTATPAPAPPSGESARPAPEWARAVEESLGYSEP